MKRLLIVALAAGCSPYGITRVENPTPPFPPAAPEVAEVCVLRSQNAAEVLDVWHLMRTVVRDNGKLVGATVKATYFCYLAQPGRHVIESDGTYGVSIATLDAEAAHRYYLAQSWLFPAVRGHALSWLDPPDAFDELQDEDYAVLTAVPGGETLPAPTPFAPSQP